MVVEQKPVLVERENEKGGREKGEEKENEKRRRKLDTNSNSKYDIHYITSFVNILLSIASLEEK